MILGEYLLNPDKKTALVISNRIARDFYLDHDFIGQNVVYETDSIPIIEPPVGILSFPSDSVIAELILGLLANAGTSAKFSRSDHTHGTPSIYTDGVTLSGNGNEDNPLQVISENLRIELRKTLSYLQWRYIGDVWNDLISLAEIIGPAGETGETGKYIVDIDFVSNDMVFTFNDASTISIIDAELTLKGDRGIQGEIGLTGPRGETGLQGVVGPAGKYIVNAEFAGNDILFTFNDASTEVLVDAKTILKGDTGAQGVQGLTGATGSQGPQGLPGIKGDQGEEIEIQNNGTYIQWKYISDTGWTNLASIESLRGLQGVQGVQGVKGDQGEAAIGTIYFMQDESSEKSGYKILSRIVPSGAEGITTVTLDTPSAEVLLNKFLSPIGDPSITALTPGIRTYNLYAAVSALTGETKIKGYLYKYSSADVETLMYQFETGNIDSLTTNLYLSNIIITDLLSMDITDRFSLKLYAVTDSATPVDVTFYFDDSSHTSHVVSPIAQGIQGVEGPVGPAGPDGPIGKNIEIQNSGTYIQWRVVGDLSWTNLIAIADITGAQGIQGEQGLKGDKGDAGAQGIQGLTGETGAKGDQGVQGLKGDKGDRGDTGLQGLQGEQGIQGDPATDTNTRIFTFVLHRGENATTGVNKTNKLIADKAYTITKAYAYATTAPTGAALIFDINKNGTTIWITQANRVQVEAAANYGTQTSFDVTTLAEGDVLSIDIDQIGSTLPGADITVQLKCEKA